MVPNGAGRTVISVDMSVEHVHFERDWLTDREIGYRSTAAALSDLAAAGAVPAAVLVALAAPGDSSLPQVSELIQGAGEAAHASAARVVGGDLSRSAVWTVAVTVLGHAERPMTRRGARAGDGLWVTGTLGAARAALEAFRAGRAPDAAARRRFAMPEPRIRAGRWLAEQGARAMLDVSDGLVADAGHLAAASGIEVEIVLEQLPVDAAAVSAALAARAEPMIFSAKGGEDYELLVALPPDFADAAVRRFEVEVGLTLTRVGSCHRGSGVRPMFRGSRLTLTGFDHFR